MPLRFVAERIRRPQPHTYAVYGPDPAEAWLDQLADAYVALRSQCRVPLPDTLVDGLDVIDPTMVARFLVPAVVPRVTHGGPLDVLRADLGEVLAYELLETEYSTHIAYKLVRDRETVRLPGRGIDAIGAEAQPQNQPVEIASPHSVAGSYDLTNGALDPAADSPPCPVLVLAEVKVSDEAASPPQVVDRARDGMRNQHRGHLREHRATTDKVWLAIRNASDLVTQEMLLRIALRRERDPHSVTTVACCVLVRPAPLAADTDCGTFERSPDDYDPACVRFLMVVLPNDVPTTLRDWDAAIGRAIERASATREEAA